MSVSLGDAVRLCDEAADLVGVAAPVSTKSRPPPTAPVLSRMRRAVHSATRRAAPLSAALQVHYRLQPGSDDPFFSWSSLNRPKPLRAADDAAARSAAGVADRADTRSAEPGARHAREVELLLRARAARSPRRLFEPAERDAEAAVRSMRASLHALEDIGRRRRAEGRPGADGRPHEQSLSAELGAYARTCAWMALSAPPSAVCLLLMDLNATA
jgi:hypothetical protein